MEEEPFKALNTITCPSCSAINRIFQEGVCSSCLKPLPPIRSPDLVSRTIADSQQATQLCESFLEKGMKDSKLNIILQGMKLVNQSSEKNIIHPHILFSSVESLHILEKFMMKNQLNPFLPFKGIITQEWDGPRFALPSPSAWCSPPSLMFFSLFLFLVGLWKKD